VEIAGVRFGPWSFSTPPEGPARRRIAMGSCAKAAEQPIFDAIRASKPDAFVFLGDNHYANTADRSALLAHYRAAHAIPRRRELLASTPIFATWDDHDFVGNNTDGNAPGKEVALRTFREYWANGRYGLPDTPGVYSAHDLGDVLLVLLDGRYARNVGGPEMLGRAQEDWLVRTLKESRATFKLVAIGSQWTLQGTPDSWAAFRTARARLFRALEDANVGGLVLLSGDVHKSELREVRAGRRTLPELTASPLTPRNSRCRKGPGLRACVAGDTPTFLTMDIDTTRRDPTLTARIVDVEGKERARWEVLRSSL
jgi:alkaline phosphatase D